MKNKKQTSTIFLCWSVFLFEIDSLNVLSAEIKHREIITNMESLHSTSQTIAKEVRYMSKKIDAINQEIAYSRQTMSSELRRLEQSLEESNYRTVDVYHHKSN